VQRSAVTHVSGPLAILAAAGSGKTRVVTRRAAYAIASGVVAPQHVLVVTFTEKAATEMADRVAALGLLGVAARTFHAAAYRQLAHFWPLAHDGQRMPEILTSKLSITVPLVRTLPGGYRFTSAKDVADEIEWAKARRIAPDRYAGVAGAAGGSGPLPPDVMARAYRDYEAHKRRSGRIDYEDLLAELLAILEADEEARRTVQGRFRWFSVDEYQDTNPLQQALLEAWLGERDDVCVVGDVDQSIFGFTGATSDYLTGFAARHPGARVIELSRNYRSSPQVLDLANRHLAAQGRPKRLLATQPPGPAPVIARFPDGEVELAALVDDIASMRREADGAASMAILVRTNAQMPAIEAALRKAGVGYRVRGSRFFERAEVRTAVAELGRLPAGEEPLRERVLAAWRRRLGFEPGPEPEAEGARERHGALMELLAMVDLDLATDPGLDAAALAARSSARAAAEAAGASDGVDLATIHRAKGLEWDAVWLPSLEEGTLPVRQAFDRPDLLAEEARLLYVALTRARRRLWLGYAERRAGANGTMTSRRPSRFLRDIAPALSAAGRTRAHVPGPRRSDGGSAAPVASDDSLDARLRTWRRDRARIDGVPAYVIAPDTALAALVERRPRTVAELRRVPGFGPARVERYGEEVLSLLRT
jgi:DNA helicase-2/ATP-dependent DNA helicase PcrA